MTVKQYDKPNRLTSIISTPTGANQSAESFGYPYNVANERLRADLADGQYWEYAYDKLGQVVSARKHWADGSLVPDQQFEYQFDDIGNRRETKEGGDESGAGLRPASYSVNSLNQYSQRTVPGAVDVIGMADPATTVQVNEQSAYRRGEYFQKAVTVANNDNPVYQAVNVTAGPASSSGHIFVPKTPEAFTYDADGNLVQDGRWNYTWDAENRLIGLESLTTVPAEAQRKIVYQYDWLGRRISKQVMRPQTGQPLNLVQSSNGGQLLAFTSQYAESWGAAKVMDGVTGGVGSSWCSAGNPGPQSFVFAFDQEQKATLTQLEIYNFGEGGGNYYSKDFTFYYSIDGNTWTTALGGTLSANEGQQVFALGSPVEARYVKLVITSGYRSDYWELGEIKVIGQLEFGVVESDLRFVYDGWNLIGELNNQLAVVKSYAWGLDLSGTLQGAGGVGGLVMENVHTGPNAGTYFPAFDGNGNVIALVKGSDGSKAAVYEYGPFAQLLRATGPMAKDNPFRFSTKYYDEETGLIYYPYRYYSPSLARWLNRDPIEENTK